MYIITLQRVDDQLPTIIFAHNDLARVKQLFISVKDAYLGVRSIAVNMYFQGAVD